MRILHNVFLTQRYNLYDKSTQSWESAPNAAAWFLGSDGRCDREYSAALKTQFPVRLGLPPPDGCVISDQRPETRSDSDCRLIFLQTTTICVNFLSALFGILVWRPVWTVLCANFSSVLFGILSLECGRAASTLTSALVVGLYGVYRWPELSVCSFTYITCVQILLPTGRLDSDTVSSWQTPN